MSGGNDRPTVKGSPMIRSAAFAIAALLAAVAGQAAAAGLDTPERAADDRDKMVCKKFVRTGSLVDGYRTCKPKWEWERERENARQFSVSDTCRDRANGGALCR